MLQRPPSYAMPSRSGAAEAPIENQSERSAAVLREAKPSDGF
jgi:hypothetical protein